jgi:hypothetical protein
MHLQALLYQTGLVSTRLVLIVEDLLGRWPAGGVSQESPRLQLGEDSKTVSTPFRGESSGNWIKFSRLIIFPLTYLFRGLIGRWGC